jgi:hypothetical protein
MMLHLLTVTTMQQLVHVLLNQWPTSLMISILLLLPSFQHDLSSAVSSFYTPLMLAFLVDSLLLYMKSCFTLDTVYMIFIYMLLYKRVRDRDYYRVPIILAEKYHLWGKQSHLWGKKNNGITISSSTGSEYSN